MKKSLFVLILFVGSTLHSALAADVAENSFHHPATSPEKALSSILNMEANIDDKRSAYLFFYVTGQSNRYAAMFRTMVTKAYRNAVSEAQRKALKNNCGGKYIEGDDCGIEINPIDCHEDIPPYYLFSTIHSSNGTTLIATEWPGQKNKDTVVTYRMKYDNNHWKIDGVDCSNQWRGHAFNME